jgi:protein TonB
VHNSGDNTPEPPVEAYAPCDTDCVVGAVPYLGPPPVGRPVLPPKPVERVIERVKPEVKPAVVEPLRVSQGVQQAKLISRPNPIYPHLAIVTRVSGIVHLEAVIGTDGRIRDLKVLSGHPLLVQAALDAVERWVYQPTMLNGSPVEILTDITVTFSLTGR